MASSRAPVRSRAKIPKGDGFLPGVSRGDICRMIKKTPPGKARDILVACCRRKDGRGIRSIARELMRAYSTVHDWLVRGFGTR